MHIELVNISKRYKNNWILKNISKTFVLGKSYALVGSNGSGKSTLLKLIAGFEHTSNGSIFYHSHNNQVIDSNDFAEHYTFCAPYQELIKEMKLKEFLTFHQKMTHKIDTQELLSVVGLSGNEDKLLDNFSSGMLQRLKLGITFFTERQIVLLDEPTSNLDTQGKNVFATLFQKFKIDKLIILASNEAFEFGLCDELLKVEDYK